MLVALCEGAEPIKVVTKVEILNNSYLLVSCRDGGYISTQSVLDSFVRLWLGLSVFFS